MTPLLRGLLLITVAAAAAADRVPMEVRAEHSAEASWRAKKVLASRLVGGSWTLQGLGDMTSTREDGVDTLRVTTRFPGEKGLPNATARRAIANEDWRGFNRLSFWVRTDAPGFPVLTLMVTIGNAVTDNAAEIDRRESTHNVTVPNGKWTQILWEIPHVARDSVTFLEFRPWVNKLLPDPWDRAAYEIRSIELQRVDPDHHDGWNVAPGKIAFSHTGYRPGSPKTAIASGLAAKTFQLVAGGKVVLEKNVERVHTRLGDFDVMDFSDVRTPGSYVIRAGKTQSQPFRIATALWEPTIAKVMNFFYGQRCGVAIPGVHEACHRDWQAVLGEHRIIMNGGWHDAGDLSQGLVNTGDATYALFLLAAKLRQADASEEAIQRVEDEAKWGLDWIHKVRFNGGFRIGFAGMNIWTNGIIGDEDDRTREALNNPNVNYIAAAAGAAAYRYLEKSETQLARKSLAIAEDDWRYAINGIESPETQSTPAFAASEMELAAIGTVASLELYKATGKPEYSRKALELIRIVLASQQTEYAGTEFPLAGFFYTGPDRKTIFHQFHRANDQLPILAMTMLCEAFPDHADWMKWYSALALYAEYQKRIASTTKPYNVLPAYVYRDDEWQTIEEGDRYGSNKETYRRQVLAGMPMGGGYYLRAFPVWFTRRGNYGVLLSQAKALSAASRLRNDPAGLHLAEQQLQWVVGRNPFAQSTMWGEGYDFVPQYAVSAGDLVGELPVGMMTRDDKDAPYWPATNSYVFKEVWVHTATRWLNIVQDTIRQAPKLDCSLATESADDGSVVISADVRGAGKHTLSLRTSNLTVDGNQSRTITEPAKVRWKARATSRTTPWIAAVIIDNDISTVRDVASYAR